MIRAISERVLMGGDEAADEDALYAETPARWKPSAAEIAHLDVCTLGPEGCSPAFAGQCIVCGGKVPSVMLNMPPAEIAFTLRRNFGRCLQTDAAYQEYAAVLLKRPFAYHPRGAFKCS